MRRSKTEDPDPAASAEAFITKMGAELCRLRTERGQSLEEVSRHLRIKTTYLFGIEQGDLTVLPGPTYALGFVRNYAEHLGLDGNDIVSQLRANIAKLGPSARKSADPWAPGSAGGVPTASVVIVSLALLGGIAAGWTYLQQTGHFDLLPPSSSSEGEAVASAETPDSASSGVQMPVVEARTPVVEEWANRVDGPSPDQQTGLQFGEPEEEIGQADAAPGGISEDAGLGGELRPTPSAEPAAPATRGLIKPAALPEPSAGPAVEPEEAAAQRPAEVLAALAAKEDQANRLAQVYETNNSDARVIVRALDSSWVQVSSVKRDYLWTRTLKPGEMLLVPNRDDLELCTGNAGGVEVMVDGNLLPPLGPPGTVLRGVSLAPDRLLAQAPPVLPTPTRKSEPTL